MAKEKKYELTDETIEVNGHTLHRIRALKDFRLTGVLPAGMSSTVKAGDQGGFIESEDNLSHLGKCWVFNDAWYLEMPMSLTMPKSSIKPAFPATP